MAAMADFDPENRDSWFFGTMSREEANEILKGDRDSGVFLVRESTSCKGDFVLCVKEDFKVSHYIVNRVQQGSSQIFKIGDQEFPNLPALLNFYKTHYLDTTSLIRPAQREKVIAKYDFHGKDPEDLPFRKGEILDVIAKGEEQWWTARNSSGQVGPIPVPYVTQYQPSSDVSRTSVPESRSPAAPPTTNHQSPLPPSIPPIGDIPLPARAIVTKKRIPNAYDVTQLELQEGQTILVTKINVSGQWEGEVNGKTGIFPFTHIRILDQNGVNSDSKSDSEFRKQLNY